ncbi:hypothetical protein [Cellulomonas sp. NPDC089187]|uniref:hypothetical protein n=1 Tax=Cellulomonas sp. NPDC089187 TaxID=3154970 RepID=UPI003418AA76
MDSHVVSAVEDLLRSEDYQQQLHDWADRTGAQLDDRPLHPVVRDILVRHLALSGFTVDEVRGVLGVEGFQSFLDAKVVRDTVDDDDPDGDFPPGETPDPADRGGVIKELGYASTVIADTAIWYLVALQGRSALARYFRAIRIPGASTYAGQVMGDMPA